MLPILALIGAVAVAEIYKRYATPAQKRKWENFARVHHGEAGAILTAAGIVTRSPTLATSGIGLMLHDHQDAKKWFRGRK